MTGSPRLGAKPGATQQDLRLSLGVDLGMVASGVTGVVLDGSQVRLDPITAPAVFDRAMSEVILPTVRGMAAEGHPYTGFLYAGLMIAADGTPKVLEYNCRFGDPETQPILMRLRSDLVDLCETALAGQLDEIETEWDARPAVGVVMAAGGYPDAYRKGDAILGLPESEIEDAKFFHAGTTLADDGRAVTSGGRVLCATALGDTVADAQTAAYNLAKRVYWDGLYYRTDIGWRAIARERKKGGGRKR